MIKAADYLIEELVNMGVKEVFLLSGGANLPIVDAISRSPDMGFVCMHHEQSAAMAAESYARVTGKAGVCLVTTGPGGTNAMTGVLGAWQDSIPCLFLSGQVRSDRLEDKPIRQLSIQGLDIVSLVKPITKYAVTIRDVSEIRFHLEKAIYLAYDGRPGPVWLDLPLDVTSQMIDPISLKGFCPVDLNEQKPDTSMISDAVKNTVEELATAKRPTILVGTGVRLSHAENEMRELLRSLQVPFVCSWNIQDLVSGSEPLYCGSPGTFGTRFANFNIQNSDLLLSIGSRLSIAQTGHNYKAFARDAKKIVVDVDRNELEKGTVVADLPVWSDAGFFIRELLACIKKDQRFPRKDIFPWVDQCKLWKEKFPIVQPSSREQKEWVNSYIFIEQLSSELTADDVIVLGVGTSFTGTFQSFIAKQGQRLFHSGGAAAMGYCLPGAIGACIANGRKRTICITGDGCIQLNLQELQTIIGYNLPIKIFMYNNRGYQAIRATQTDWFEKRFAASSEEGGLSFPDMQKISKAYGFATFKFQNQDNLRERIREVLSTEGPTFCEIMMDPQQPLIPYLSYSTRKDGSRYPASLEDLYPLLDRKELKDNMLINLWEEPDNKEIKEKV